MLVKTSVARKLLRQAWRQSDPVGRAAIYKIDAMQHFGAAVEACLFILPVAIGASSQDCDVFASLQAAEPESTIGFHDGFLVSDVQSYTRHRDLIATNAHYVWRSGVKHDCSKVMELAETADGRLTNGLGEQVHFEPDLLFPLLKSSDVAKGRIRADLFMVVTQNRLGRTPPYSPTPCRKRGATFWPTRTNSMPEAALFIGESPASRYLASVPILSRHGKSPSPVSINHSIL